MHTTGPLDTALEPLWRAIRIMHMQKVRKQGVDARSFVFNDDVAEVTAASKVVQEQAMKGRHFDVFTSNAVQHVPCLTPCMRSNVDYFFIFKVGKHEPETAE